MVTSKSWHGEQLPSYTLRRNRAALTFTLTWSHVSGQHSLSSLSLLLWLGHQQLLRVISCSLTAQCSTKQAANCLCWLFWEGQVLYVQVIRTFSFYWKKLPFYLNQMLRRAVRLNQNSQHQHNDNLFIININILIIAALKPKRRHKTLSSTDTRHQASTEVFNK